MRGTPGAGHGALARHLRLLSAGTATAGDSARADVLVLEMRDGLRRYRDIAAARADGFEDLAAADSGRVTHLVNWKWAVEEAFRFNPEKPAALVYRTASDGDPVLVGAMYTAPDGASIEALDRRLPVRVARWHQHVDWCTPKRGDDARWTETARDGEPVFGPGSAIATRAACDSVAGAFHSHVFGWMVHANVFASDEPRVIWAEPGEMRDTVVAPQPVAPAPAPAPVSVPAPVPVAPAPVASAPPRAVVPAADTALPVRPAPVPAPVVVSAGVEKGTFTSAGVPVAYERFRPAGGGRHAAIVLLHAGSGMRDDSVGGEVRSWADGLAQHGYVTEIVHYLDVTGTTSVNAREGFVHWPAWNHAVGDAITQMASDPTVDTAKVALLGVSFGGKLAVLHAAADPRVKCVVDYFGGFGEPGARRITRMPPVDLIGIEGDADMLALRDALARLNVSNELHVYPGRDGKLAPSDRRDAAQAADRFLAACVKANGP
jgi:dienelactone hydrolase